ncbi:alkaline phosphatase family protein [Stetteria hydrogenophila]
MLVIALDALEYDLVVGLGLRSLMQRRYGKLPVPRELYHYSHPVPFTPKVWTAILTGRPPGEGEAEDLWVYENRLLERLRWLPPLRWVKGKRKLLEKLGFKPRVRMFRIHGETILDRCAPSLAVNVPGVNIWEDWMDRLRRLVSRGDLQGAIQAAFQYTREVFTEFERRARRERGHRLYMVYSNLADYVGHLCWYRCRGELERAYRLLALWAPRLKAAVDPDVTLIVSDHGMQGSDDGVSGDHSDHMYWSLNIDHEFRDIYEIPRRIVEWCSQPAPREAGGA